jgi:D-arabinose 1-dehydrogenase-like Zn-dependent alcohol dehydrogenase
MRSVQVSKPKGPLEIVEKGVTEPRARQVRIKVQACGICHSDSITKEGLFPFNIQGFPVMRLQGL